MKRQIAVFLCSAVLGLMIMFSHAIAQQKTVRECREEWRANKAANQASGVTEKAYVAQCRAGGAPAQTTAAPAAPAAPAPAPTAAAPPTSPTQKTVRECREEWRANKAANQASGVTEKAYVAQCRAGGAPAQTTAAPAAPAAPAPAPTAAAPPTSPTQKTVRECREEWRANKAANQASGVTEKAYVAQCRAGGAPAQTTAAPAAPAAPAPAPTATPAAPAPTPTAAAPPVRPVRPVPPPTTASPVPSTPNTPVPANQFSTEAEAKARCPSDTVVWVNLSSKIYHFSGSKSYGTTKNGDTCAKKKQQEKGCALRKTRRTHNSTHNQYCETR